VTSDGAVGAHRNNSQARVGQEGRALLRPSGRRPRIVCGYVAAIRMVEAGFATTSRDVDKAVVAVCPSDGARLRLPASRRVDTLK